MLSVLMLGRKDAPTDGLHEGRNALVGGERAGEHGGIVAFGAGPSAEACFESEPHLGRC
jgi:hypothetical protein